MNPKIHSANILWKGMNPNILSSANIFKKGMNPNNFLKLFFGCGSLPVCRERSLHILDSVNRASGMLSDEDESLKIFVYKMHLSI